MNEPQPIDPPPARTRLSAEMITALSAVLIGVCAIAVSLYETTLMRQQLKGAVWPHLGVGFSYNNQGFRYVVSNDGVGPARIMYVVIRVDGNPVANWEAYFKVLGLQVGSYQTSWLPGRVLAPNAQVEPLVLAPDEDIDQLFRLQSRVTYEICYCSVHEDCWRVSGDTGPAAVRRCVTDERPLFAN
jgi:hypothetical protein